MLHDDGLEITAEKSAKSARTQETMLSHTGQCFSPRLLNHTRSEICFQTLEHQLVVQLAPLPLPVAQPPLPSKRRSRKKRKWILNTLFQWMNISMYRNPSLLWSASIITEKEKKSYRLENQLMFIGRIYL